jgi:hypothetical protein
MGIGDAGAAYFTATIAVHTFNSLVLRYKQPVWVIAATVGLGWTAALATGELPLCIGR